MNIHEKVDQYVEDGLFLLSKLISYQTVLDRFNPDSPTPFGKENAQALKFFLTYAKQDGFSCFNCDSYAGHIEFGDGEETLGILAHMDVVPVSEEEWESNPFVLSIRDHKLYGRGVADDKGPLVATYMAMKLLKDAGFEPKKKVRLIVGCDEESGSRCLKHYFQTQPLPQLGFSPDADFPLIYGEKAHFCYDLKGRLQDEEIIVTFHCGDRYNVVPSTAQMRLSVDLEEAYRHFLKENGYNGTVKDGVYTAYGIASHAMIPQNGLNAAFILFAFLNAVHPTPLSEFFVNYLTFDPFGKKMGYAMSDPKMKELTSNVGVVHIADRTIKIGVDCRVPKKDCLEELKAAIDRSCAASGFLESEILDFSGYHYVDPNGSLVQTLMNVYQEVTHDFSSQPMTIGGGTYAKFLTNGVAFGPKLPEREDVCHIANEYMYLDDFRQEIELYAKAIYELTK